MPRRAFRVVFRAGPGGVELGLDREDAIETYDNAAVARLRLSARF